MTPLLLALLLALPPHLAPRWTPVEQARVRASWSDVKAAAREAHLRPEVLAAVLVLESGLEGGHVNPTTGAEGLGQVIWVHWGPMLSVAGYERADLHDPRLGVRAVGLVFAEIRRRWPRSEALTLCIYGAGLLALGWQKDCLYSRDVQALAREIRAWRSK